MTYSDLSIATDIERLSFCVEEYRNLFDCNPFNQGKNPSYAGWEEKIEPPIYYVDNIIIQ